MKLLRLLFISGFLVLLTIGIKAQNDSVYLFSLEQAKEYGLQNNLKLKNAMMDVKSAKQKVWETTAMGLPHASGSGSYTYNINIPALYEQFASSALYSDTNFVKLPPDQQQAIIDEALDEMRSSTTFDITVTQLIFSGSYIVGLQTSKIFKSLSEYSYQTSEDEVLQNIINSYYSVLIVKENVSILDSTYANFSKILYEMQKLYEAGMTDETNLDQIKISHINILNALSQVKKQYNIIQMMLKYQLGLNLSDSLVLTDNLDNLISNLDNNSLLLDQYNLENDPNYQLVLTSEKLQKQNLNLKRSEYLPTLSGYYMHHKNFNENAIDFYSKDQVGLSLSVPIFSSGERISKVSQAKIGYLQAQNNTYMTSQMLEIGVEDAKSSYLNALNKIYLDKQSLDLSKKVYDQTVKKYKEGMASSLDLTQAQNQYLQNQGTYYSTIYELISAKTKLEKSYNKLSDNRNQ